MRHRSAATMTRTRGNRSITAPATGASSKTGAISAMTAPVTPRPEPVRRNTSTTRATVLKVSPRRTLLANSRAGGLGDLLRPRGAQRDAPEPEAVDDDDVATVQPRGPSRHGAGRAGGVPQGMPGDPDPRRARRAVGGHPVRRVVRGPRPPGGLT